ncbi:MAG TPA: DMT family transporter [Dongiaceae bacterium]|nr:DMT family transporter [Dongiaceae bacterium]
MGRSGNILARRFAPPPPLRAALWMVGSAVFFSGLSGVIRHLGQEMHPFEVAFFRNLFGLAFMLPWLWRAGRAGLKTRRLALYGVRAFLGLLSMLCWFTALALLPIAQVVALSFTAPLFATMAAALFLGETVRARRWTATLAGLVGVGVILWPQLEGTGGAGLSPGAILALLSTAISVAITLIVKRLTRTEPANAIVTYMVLIMTPMSLVPAAFVWTWPPLDTWLWLVALGGLGSLGHVCYVRSFALADASAVMPYDYTRLLFAALIGWIAFGELPTLYTWIGAAVIVASAIYIARREALFNQSAATSAAAAAGEGGLAATTEAKPMRPPQPGG